MRNWRLRNDSQAKLADATENMNRQQKFIKLARKLNRKDIETRHMGYFWSSWKSARMNSSRLPA